MWVWAHSSASSEATWAHCWIKEPISSAVLSHTHCFVIERPAPKCIYAAYERALCSVVCFCGSLSSPAITGIEINNHFSASNSSHCVESPLSWNCRAPPPTHKHTKHAHTHMSINFMCTPWVALEKRQSAASQLFTPEKGSCLAFRLAWSTTI